MKRLSLLLLLSVCFLAWGCGGSNPQGRLPLEGEVTLDGTPLANGSITFEPSGSQTERTQAGGEILNGKYSIPAANGVVAGEYLARITSMREVPGSRVDDPDPMKVHVEYENVVPPEYGAKSTQKVTVEKGQKNNFDFKM